MCPDPPVPILSQDYWNCITKELKEELIAFVKEFGSFTPDWFAEVRFHLLKESGLSLMTRDEFCQVSIHSKQCAKCDHLYMSRNCLLWYQLFEIITWTTIKRAPPCIKVAYKNKSIKTVANFLKRANLVSPPYYKARAAPYCKNMQEWGYCQPDEFCKAMKSGRVLDYSSVREQVKMNR